MAGFGDDCLCVVPPSPSSPCGDGESWDDGSSTRSYVVELCDDDDDDCEDSSNYYCAEQDMWNPPPRCENPPRCGLRYFVMAAGKQFNDHLYRLAWAGDGDLPIPYRCTWLQLLYTLMAINLTAIRRVAGLFPAVVSSITMLGLTVQFVTGRMLAIADTPNRRDRYVKTVVLLAQCAVIAVAAYAHVYVCTLVVRTLLAMAAGIMSASPLTAIGFSSFFEFGIFIAIAFVTLYCA